MNKRNIHKTITCPICGREFKSLGYARHRAMHRDQLKNDNKHQN